MELNIQRLRLEELDTELVAEIHDEVIVPTPLALADEVRCVVEQAMIEGMQIFSVPFRSLQNPSYEGLNKTINETHSFFNIATSLSGNYRHKVDVC